ncbi:hypothetical protein C450_15875 [Halococcus salifodinae DSM 8989]|uniref:Uncharacterized protein n=1 Tax=Halococcus salifodinae DSM 8989 TaxID=1227456 RepID=M0MXL7_9EURY|nr:hypothetical protein C450_15875 [Halococcus salifodinae DSM 8989]
MVTAFLKRFSNGEFDEANDLIHSEGPLEGAGDVAMILSAAMTNFLATVILRTVPTEVTEVTVVEEGPTTASIEASLDVATVVEIDALVELRPSDYDGSDLGDGRRNGWCVWNVDVRL